MRLRRPARRGPGLSRLRPALSARRRRAPAGGAVTTLDQARAAQARPAASAWSAPGLAWAAAAAVCLALFFFLYLATGAKLAPIHGDTDRIVRSISVVRQCVHDRVFVNCGRLPGGSRVSHDALLQFIPAYFFVRLGVSVPHTVSWLARLNTVSFFAALACVVALCRRVPRLRTWAPELFLVLLVSPLLFYGLAAFGEMLTASLGMLAVAAVIARKPVLAGVVLFFACTGKETVAPFFFLLAVVCARDPDDGLLPARRMLVPLAAGATLAVLAAIGLNVFRYGRPDNLVQLYSGMRTIGGAQIGKYFVALWLAPGGGLFWYWVPAFALLVGAAWLAVRSRHWPSAVVVAVVVVFQFGLALWADPFGWTSWGPRLTIPVIPAAALAAVYVGGDALRAVVDRVLAPVAAAVAVAAVMMLATLPQSGSVWAYAKAMDAYFTPAPGCPRGDALGRASDHPAFFFGCVNKVAWRWKHSELLGGVPIDRRSGKAAQVVLAGGAGSLVAVAHRRARARRNVTA